MTTGPGEREAPEEFSYGGDAPTLHTAAREALQAWQARQSATETAAGAAPTATARAVSPPPVAPRATAVQSPPVAQPPPVGSAEATATRHRVAPPPVVFTGGPASSAPASTSRLSPAGWSVLVAGVVLGGAGWGLGYMEAAALGVAALVAVLVALAWTHSVPELEARREIVPTRVARGDVAQGVVVLRNNGTRTLRGLRAEDRVAGRPVYPVDLPPVAPGTEIRARYRLPTLQRGEVEVGPMMLVRTDPLGLARRVRECGSAESLIVHPRTVLLPVLPAGRTHHLEGPNSDTADDGTLTFHSLREYVLGDDLRRVHWRSSARTGRLMVRRMIDVSLPTTTVVLDTSRDSYSDPEAFETAVDVAASVAESAALNHFPVRVLTAGGVLPLAHGHDQGVDHVLDRLTRVEPEHDRTLSDALDVLERMRDGDTLVVVSGGERPLPADRLARLGRRFDRMMTVTSGGGHAAASAIGLPRIAVDRVEDLETAWRRETMR